MPGTRRRTPISYDEIVRRTVPEPDTSFRPSKEEEELSRHRFGEATEHIPHPLTRRERALLERVRAAAEADSTLDLSGVQIDVDGYEVVLTGWVPGPATKIRLEELVATVDDVDAIDNQLAIRIPRT